MSHQTLPHTSNNPQPHESSEGAPNQTLIGTAVAEEQQDVVGFRSEGRSSRTVMDLPTEDISLMSSLRPNNEMMHTIQAYLSRQARITSVEWKFDNKMGQILGEFDIIKELQKDNLSHVREKISGFYGMHATANLKVVVNCQPFQQGIFQIFYIPFERNFINFPYAYNGTPLSAIFGTGCPNVICNIATSQTVELSVPYTGSNAFIHIPSLITDKRDWGTFYLQNLSSISDSSNAASVEIAVYMFFTDVELFGATPVTWTAQMDRGLEAAFKTAKSAIAPEGLLTALPEVLDLLGLSKPTINQNPSRMLLSPFANLANFDSTSAALKLSGTSDQNVEMGNLGVDSRDEMDINNIISKPCLRQQFSWTTSDPIAKVIGKLTVNPNSNITVSTGGTSNFVLVGNSRLRYVANLFRFWRGDIIYTIHIACTKMHTGRLRFIYNIGGDLPTKVGKALPYVFSQIVDIKDGLTFQIKCPYFASTPWRHVPNIWDSTQNRFVLDHYDAYDDLENNLNIMVELPLQAAPNVSNTVTILVFEHGASNFEFAGPKAPESVPVQIVPTPTSSLRSKSRAIGHESLLNKVPDGSPHPLEYAATHDLLPSFEQWNTQSTSTTPTPGTSKIWPDLENEADFSKYYHGTTADNRGGFVVFFSTEYVNFGIRFNSAGTLYSFIDQTYANNVMNRELWNRIINSKLAEFARAKSKRDILESPATTLMGNVFRTNLEGKLFKFDLNTGVLYHLTPRKKEVVDNADPMVKYMVILLLNYLRRQPETVKPQGDLDMPMIDMVSGISISSIRNLLSHKLTIGEQVTNLRPLIRRYFHIGHQTFNRDSAIHAILYPFAIIQPYLQTEPGQEVLYYDFFVYISYLYRFYRGGMRYLFRANGNPDNRILLKYDPNTNQKLPRFTVGSPLFGKNVPAFAISTGVTADDIADFRLIPSSVVQPFHPQLQGGAEIEIPYYSKCHKLPFRTVPQVASTILKSVDEQIYPEGIVYVQIDSTSIGDKNKTTVDVFRATADDFNFGFILGAPPTTLYTNMFKS